MPEAKKQRSVRHRGRGSQIWIYLGKFFRMFIFQSDWKVLPMSAVIAALVSMVISPGMFVTKEGTTLGSFALTCVCIWNGCFNSIQVVCRERGIVKREHRSGMHVSSYIVAHMIYQAFLCLAQTGILLIVGARMGLKYPQEGFLFAHQFWPEFAITIFLITYASDMLSLLISCIARNTTLAMTVMPFLLIFQLVFSGGMFSLPSWSQPLSYLTISNYGLCSINAQANFNKLPSVVAWNTLFRMRNNDISGSLTPEQLAQFLQDKNFRDQLQGIEIEGLMTADDLVDLVVEDLQTNSASYPPLELHFKIQDLFDTFGENTVRDYVLEATSNAANQDRYAQTGWVIAQNWVPLACFSLLFALLSMAILKFIDKDKR